MAPWASGMVMAKVVRLVHLTGYGMPLTSMAATANGALPERVVTALAEVKLLPLLLVMVNEEASLAASWLRRNSRR